MTALVHNLGAIPRLNASALPGKIGYSLGHRTLTWAEVDQRANALSALLRERRVRAGDHVAILGQNDLDWICAEFALWKTGAVPVLVHAGLTQQSLLAQLAQAEVSAVLGGPDTYERLASVLAAKGPSTALAWGGSPPPGVADIDALLPDYDDTQYEQIEPGLDSTAMIAYSSGTTGTPKGTVVTYRHVQARLLSMIVALELRRDDVGMILGPLFMGGTQNLSLIPYAAMGMTTVIQQRPDAIDALTSISGRGVSVFFAVPTMLRSLVDHASDAFDVSSLTRVVSSGAPLPPELYRAVTGTFDCGVYEICGTFETGGGLSVTERERRSGKAASVGRPMLGYVVEIHSAAGVPVGPGERGEVVYGGVPVAHDYYNRPPEPDTLTSGGMFRSGDVGFCDDDGYFYLVDRTKDVVNSGGQNVYPREVEDVLLEMDGVGECAVIGLPHDKWGEAVHAIIRRDGRSEITEAEVIAYGRQQLAPFQVPKSVDFVEEIPKTAVGKVSKRELRERYSR
jgi:fatty-acyl-CoA synthase